MNNFVCYIIWISDYCNDEYIRDCSEQDERYPSLDSSEGVEYPDKMPPALNLERPPALPPGGPPALPQDRTPNREDMNGGMHQSYPQSGMTSQHNQINQSHGKFCWTCVWNLWNQFSALYFQYMIQVTREWFCLQFLFSLSKTMHHKLLYNISSLNYFLTK